MKTNIPVRQLPSKSVQDEIISNFWQKEESKPQETPTISHDSEKEVSQEPEYDKCITMPVFYTLMIVALLVTSYLSYTKYQINEQRIEANRQVQILSTSTGAKIDRLLQEKSVNQKNWEKEQKLKEQAQKQIDSSMIKQAEYNASTYGIDEEIKKFGISITQ